MSERISERVTLMQEWVVSNLGMIFTTAGLKKSPPYGSNVNSEAPMGTRDPRLHNTALNTTLVLAFLPSSERMEHSRHEEDASSVGHAASSGWGGMPVVATHTTQQAQEEEGHNEGQQEADNQATQPPGGKRTVLSYIFWL